MRVRVIPKGLSGRLGDVVEERTDRRPAVHVRDFLALRRGRQRGRDREVTGLTGVGRDQRLSCGSVGRAVGAVAIASRVAAAARGECEQGQDGEADQCPPHAVCHAFPPESAALRGMVRPKQFERYEPLWGYRVAAVTRCVKGFEEVVDSISRRATSKLAPTTTTAASNAADPLATHVSRRSERSTRIEWRSSGDRGAGQRSAVCNVQARTVGYRSQLPLHIVDAENVLA